ncbi:GlxA family transcriptional regulator [Kangiella sp. M94]
MTQNALSENTQQIQRPMEVAILAISQATPSTVYGMNDLLCSVGRDWPFVTRGELGPSLIKPSIVSLTGQPISAVNHGYIHPHRKLTEDYFPDAVCVLEVFVDPKVKPSQLTEDFKGELQWLRNYWQKGGTVAAACTGSLLLAAAGLLENQEATTHWAYCEFFQNNYPKIHLAPNRALVTAGEGQRLIMAGGGTSWMDLGLYLISRFVGVEEAIKTAKVQIIEWHEHGQQPYVYLNRARQSEDAIIADSQVWLAQNYEHPAPVTEAVKRSGLTERTFKRRFKLATGMSPIEYVLTLRIEEAKQMLETTTLPVEAIANEVGYQDASFFGRKFNKMVGITPAQYRKKFAMLRKHLQ